jgi:hypothetical protein
VIAADKDKRIKLKALGYRVCIIHHANVGVGIASLKEMLG